MNNASLTIPFEKTKLRSRIKNVLNTHNIYCFNDFKHFGLANEKQFCRFIYNINNLGGKSLKEIFTVTVSLAVIISILVFLLYFFVSL